VCHLVDWLVPKPFQNEVRWSHPSQELVHLATYTANPN
jgi:hypothetical protein